MFLSNTYLKLRLNVSWNTNVMFLHWLPYEGASYVGLFWTLAAININKERILQALQIFLCVTLSLLQGQQLSRPLNIEGYQLSSRLMMESLTRHASNKMLWMFICRCEWMFHHGVIEFCGSPTQRRTSAALRTVRPTGKCGHEPWGSPPPLALSALSKGPTSVK